MRKTYLVVLLLFGLYGCKKDTTFQKPQPAVVSDPLQNTAQTSKDTLTVIKSFRLNNITVPFDRKTSMFYFPASLTDKVQEYTLSLTDDVSSISFDRQGIMNNSTFKTKLRVNQVVKVRIYDKKKTKWDFNLLVTGLPVVNLTTDKMINSEKMGVTFNLVDPDYKTHKGNWLESGHATINVRGASSRAYPKKSLAFKLTDDTYEDADRKIMGLREDNSWILDAMYIDQARMRNRLCTDIWNTMNKVPYFDKEPEALNGTRGYLVELFANNEYRGVYCLTEKLDRKQLKAKKKTGLVYKGDQWADNIQFKGTMLSYDNNSATWGGWSFDYPEIGDEPAPDWKPLHDFTDFVINATNTDFVNEIANKVDIDNMIDYLLFVNAVAAEDNTAKNTFISTYDHGKSKFFFSVWDLDGSMGRAWNGKPYQNGNFVFLGLNNHLFKRLSFLNPGAFRAKLRNRWFYLRNNQLSKSAVNARIYHYAAQLVVTHAGEREQARWNNVTQDFETEARYISAWYSQHYDALDQYITAIPGYN